MQTSGKQKCLLRRSLCLEELKAVSYIMLGSMSQKSNLFHLAFVGFAHCHQLYELEAGVADYFKYQYDFHSQILRLQARSFPSPQMSHLSKLTFVSEIVSKSLSAVVMCCLLILKLQKNNLFSLCSKMRL